MEPESKAPVIDWLPAQCRSACCAQIMKKIIKNILRSSFKDSFTSQTKKNVTTQTAIYIIFQNRRWISVCGSQMWPTGRNFERRYFIILNGTVSINKL